MNFSKKITSLIALILSLVMIFVSCELPDVNPGGGAEIIGDFELGLIPDPDVNSAFFDGYVVVNGGVPYFTDEEKETDTCFEKYSDFDSLGRAGVAFACVCKNKYAIISARR